MQGFTKLFVVPIMNGRRWARLCEIGSCEGAGTNMMRKVPKMNVTVIDPCLDCDLQARFASDSRVDMRKGLSLEVLPQLNDPFDCILIDGDHNWYTVYNELKLIAKKHLLRRGGIVFMHDVHGPWARRDMYYQPETIPSEYRHKFELARTFSKAISGGGPRNGVLTALEDFLRENRADCRFFRVKAGNGLGILQYKGGFRDDLTFFLLAAKGMLCSSAAILLKLTGLRHLPNFVTRKFLRASA